jgi:hypothetical protein
MNSKEDERVAHCSVEEWEAGSIRLAQVVVEIDAHLAGSYPTTGGTMETDAREALKLWKSIRAGVSLLPPRQAALPRLVESQSALLRAISNR